MQNHTNNLAIHCRAPLKMAWYYRRLLLDWVNLGGRETAEKLRRLHPRVIAPIAGQDTEYVVTNVKMLLQRAWESEDARDRTWCLNLARTLYARGCVAAAFGFGFYDLFPGMPQGDAAIFDSALFYAQTKLASKMQVCRAKCVTPYFFREDKRQRYCCTDCRDPARDAGQRKYWAMRGRLLRAERMKKQKLLALKSRA
jgi:hypothetical protein